MKRTGLRVARSRVGGRAVAEVMRWVPQAVPGVIYIGTHVVVAPHPTPIAPGHLVAVTRRRVHDVRSPGAAALLDELAGWLGRQDRPDVRRLVTNVGIRQDVPLLHVHLLGAGVDDALRLTL